MAFFAVNITAGTYVILEGAEQAVEAWKWQISRQEYPNDHKELDTALKYWGY